MLSTNNLDAEDLLLLQLFSQRADESAVSTIVHSERFSVKRFMSLARRHLLDGEASDALLRLKIRDGLPLSIEKACLREAALASAAAVKLRYETLSVMRLLTDNELECAVMKGTSLDFSGFRRGRDIDILIKPEVLERASELLSSGGFSSAGGRSNLMVTKSEIDDLPGQMKWNCQFQFEHREAGYLVELHTGLFEKSRIYSESLKSLHSHESMFLKGRVFDDELGTWRMNNADMLFLMCMHSAVKRPPSSDGFLLRNTVDITRLVNKPFDMERFLETVRKTGTACYIFFSLKLTSMLFKGSIDEKLLSSLREMTPRRCTAANFFHFRSFKNLSGNSTLFSNIYRTLIPLTSAAAGPGMLRALFPPLLFPRPVAVCQAFRLRLSGITLAAGYLLWPLMLLCKGGKLVYKKLNHTGRRS